MIQVFEYNNNPVSFYQKDDAVYMNATEMAKRFNKKPNDWIRLKSTQQFSEVVCVDTGIPVTELIQVVQGGASNRQGTWLHEIMALDFAQWLSPKFKLWCMERLKELMTHGFTATPDKLDELINNPDLVIGLANKLKEEREKNSQLQTQNQLQANQLKAVAPKADYYDLVMQSDGAIRTTVIANDLGMSAKKLNTILYMMGIQRKVGDTWVLYAAHQNKGYTTSLTHPYMGSDGMIKTKILTCWTEKGREFIMKSVEAYTKNQTA